MGDLDVAMAAVWEFEDNNGHWQEYTAGDAQTLEAGWVSQMSHTRLEHGRWEYRITLPLSESSYGLQVNMSTGRERRVRRRSQEASPQPTRNRTNRHRRQDRGSSCRRVVSVGSEPLFMHVETRESRDDKGKYKVFHVVRITTDPEDSQSDTSSVHVRSVSYHTPNQGFQHHTRERRAAPFEIRYGPCWGLPHLTVDLLLNNSVRLRAVFEDNLPRSNRSFLIYEPPAPTSDEPADPPLAIRELSPLGHTLQPDQVPPHLICSVSCEVFQDPVVCMDGHTYDRCSIERWFVDHETSPMTNMKLPSKTLIPNLALRQELDCLANGV